MPVKRTQRTLRRRGQRRGYCEGHHLTLIPTTHLVKAAPQLVYDEDGACYLKAYRWFTCPVHARMIVEHQGSHGVHTRAYRYRSLRTS